MNSPQPKSTIEPTRLRKLVFEVSRTKRLFFLIGCLTISVVSFGQDRAGSSAAAPAISQNATMEETQAWIKRELPTLGAYSIVMVKNDGQSKPLTLKYEIESAVLADGRLSIRRREFWGEIPSPMGVTEIVTLKDVDVSKILAVEKPAEREYTFSKPRYFVSLIAAADRGEPFTSQVKQGSLPAREIKPAHTVRVLVRDLDAANRVAAVLRRAAVLCGAPSPPIVAAVAEPVQVKADTKLDVGQNSTASNAAAPSADTRQPASAVVAEPAQNPAANSVTVAAAGQQTASPAAPEPASPAKSKMTNTDVIQMFTAGLSEQVVTLSIRQAREKEFDLSPTGLIALKKAGLPDTVILVMQNGGAQEKPAAAGDNNAAKSSMEPAVKSYLQQRITSESRGALALLEFTKVNGYEQEITKLYVLEWQAEIQFQQEGWKLGDAFMGYWNDFQIAAQNPKTGGLNDLLLAAGGKGDAKHFNKGAKLRLTGDCTLRKTEQGWRVEEFTVKTTQVLAEGGPAASPSPGAGPAGTTAAATSNPASLESLSAAIERGEEVVFKIKYNYSPFLGTPEQLDGTVTVSRAVVAFRPSANATGFSVSPDKILEVINEPNEAKRVRLKVAVKNKKGDREDKKSFQFYHPSTFASGDTVVCQGCDDSMTVLYTLLQKTRNGSK